MQDSSRIFGANGKENNIENLKPTEFKVSHFLYFESVISSKRRKEFRAAEMGEWMGDESAKELFEVWKKLKLRCKRSKEETNNEAMHKEAVTTDNNITEIYDGTENNNMHEIMEIVGKDNEINIIKNNMIEDAINVYETDENQINNSEAKDKDLVGKIPQNNNITVDEESQEKRIYIHSNIVIRPTTPTQNINISQERQNKKISTSFLDHIFWPEESPEKNSKVVKRERLPFASTSYRWLQYHEDKQKLKREKEENKREKAILRKRKKEEKLQEATYKKK